MRLDTSGFGRYEVELSDDIISILRDGEAILEGFFPIDSYAGLEQEVLAAGDCQVIERQGDPPSLLYCVPEEDGYTFLAQIEGSTSSVMFFILGDVAGEEALDRVHRLQFTQRG